MQVSEDNKSAKWLTLESPKISYTTLLIRIKDNLGEREMDTFQFAFRDELPRTVLEVRNFLQWFIELENRCLLSPDDLSRLENFLQLVSLRFLLKDIRCFQAKRIVVRFFQRSVEAKIPELKLDEKFNQFWTSNERLPRNFLKKCQELFRGIDSEVETFTVKDLCNLLSRGAGFLVNSCLPCSHDVDVVAVKVLYLSHIVFQRFERMFVEQMDQLKEFLSSGSERLPEPVLVVVQPMEMERPPVAMKQFFLNFLACLAFLMLLISFLQEKLDKEKQCMEGKKTGF